MPLPLPNLDDRTFADLMDEAKSLIPGLAPDWSDHNPSDPGMTLIELFAWLTEMLLYRIDQIPEENYVAYLKILNGPRWQFDGDLDAAMREAVLRLRQRFRAVTVDDYEYLVTRTFPEIRVRKLLNVLLTFPNGKNVLPGLLKKAKTPGSTQLQELTTSQASELTKAIEANPEIDLQKPWKAAGVAVAEMLQSVATVMPLRARCIPRRDLTPGPNREKEAEGHVSVVVVAVAKSSEPTPPAILPVLLAFLEERRLLCTKQHVVAPDYVKIAITASLVRFADFEKNTVSENATARLRSYFDQLTGGREGKGWPFGRNVYPSEIYAVLEQVEGVDYAMDLKIHAENAAGEKRAPVDPDGHIKLKDYELVEFVARKDFKQTSDDQQASDLTVK